MYLKLRKFYIYYFKRNAMSITFLQRFSQQILSDRILLVVIDEQIKTKNKKKKKTNFNSGFKLELVITYHL